MPRKFLYICQVYCPYLAVGLLCRGSFSIYVRYIAPIPCRGSFSFCVRYIGLYLAVEIPYRGSFSKPVKYIGIYLAVGIPCL